MSYRSFAPPDNNQGWTTHNWSGWLVDQRPLVYVPVLPRQEAVCDVCLGPTLLAPDGTPFRRCFNCRRAGTIEGLVPISYSWARGMESAIHGAKSGGDWLNLPLASLLHRFLTAHLDCVERRYGTVDVITMLPSHPDARGGWDHMRRLHAGVGGAWPASDRWDLDLLVKNDPSRADQRRGQADPALFSVTRDVRQKQVLLIDDTWTSGGSMYSAGATLLDAGARKPVSLTIGRQFHPEDDRTRAWCDTLEQGEEADITKVCPVHV